MNFILCGLPMSGKTTIGKLLAEKLKWNFYDTDQLLEEAFALQTGRNSSCRVIFKEDGENIFRKLEKAQITSLQSVNESIIAVGGGAVSDAENVVMLKKLGHIIYLKVLPELIWDRVRSRGIPAYLDQNNPQKDFYELAEKRLPHYETAADEAIEIKNLSAQDVVDVVALLIKRLNNGE